MLHCDVRFPNNKLFDEYLVFTLCMLCVVNESVIREFVEFVEFMNGRYFDVLSAPMCFFRVANTRIVFVDNTESSILNIGITRETRVTLTFVEAHEKKAHDE